MSKTAEQRARAYELVSFLREHPEMHDQDFWLCTGPQWNGEPMTTTRVFEQCGTTACAAGWTVLLAGGKALDGTWAELDGKRARIQTHARILLGLTNEEADWLFIKAEALGDVLVVIDEIFGPRPAGERVELGSDGCGCLVTEEVRPNGSSIGDTQRTEHRAGCWNSVTE